MSNSVLDLSKEFAGRRALVTGGSRGIGAAIAQRLLDGGANVAVVARNRHEQTPKDALFIQGDILTPEGCKKLVDEAVKALGGLDILVNNAAEAKLVLPNSEAISDELWQRTIASNLLSVVRVTNAALPSLKESKEASILNISSGSDLPGNGPLVHYGASKAAMNYYTKALAKELAPDGIRVNCVCPGTFLSGIHADLPAEAIDAIAAKHPLGLGSAGDLVGAYAYLASDAARWTTGSAIVVDGGYAAP